jgi:hypothetical protein
MKIEKLFGIWQVPDEMIARFGPVRLVQKAAGHCELSGGSPAERATARAWCNRFAPLINFHEPSLEDVFLVAILKRQLHEFSFGRKCGREEFVAAGQPLLRQLGPVERSFIRKCFWAECLA